VDLLVILTPPFSRGNLSVKQEIFDINKRLKTGSVSGGSVSVVFGFRIQVFIIDAHILDKRTRLSNSPEICYYSRLKNKGVFQINVTREPQALISFKK
jgi:hypothetical protein